MIYRGKDETTDSHAWREDFNFEITKAQSQYTDEPYRQVLSKQVHSEKRLFNSELIQLSRTPFKSGTPGAGQTKLHHQSGGW